MRSGGCFGGERNVCALPIYLEIHFFFLAEQTDINV